MKPRIVLATLAATLLLMSTSVVHAQQRAADGAILISQSTVIGGLPEDTSGFPITIARPGLYRLTSNIVVPNADTTAILITASHVTLDLNGFAILGPTVCVGAPVTSCSPTGSGNGVESDGDTINVIVRNGIVNGMGSSGIDLGGRNTRIERINATNNGHTGIFNSFDGIVSDNVASRNGVQGIAARGVLLNNMAAENHGLGFNTGNLAGAAFNVLRNNGDAAQMGPATNQTGGNVCNSILCP